HSQFNIHNSALKNPPDFSYFGNSDGKSLKQFPMKKFLLRSVWLFLLLCGSLHAQSSWQWARQAFQDSVYSHGTCAAVDHSGNVLMGGNYAGPWVAFAGDSLPLAGQDNIYLVKYDHNGNVLWTFAGTNRGHDELLSIATDQWDNIFISGA